MPKGETRNTRARKASEQADELIKNPVKPTKDQVDRQRDQTDLFKYRRDNK